MTVKTDSVVQYVMLYCFELPLDRRIILRSVVYLYPDLHAGQRFPMALFEKKHLAPLDYQCTNN